MRITVDRFTSDDDSTVSRVSIDGTFFCFGLEDEYREEKVPGETRIPAGTYQVRLRTTGGFHQRYLNRFPDIHRGMLHVQDVPNFEYILIHIGNTDEDTAGCLLVGEQAITKPGEMSVSQSRSAYQRLYPLVVDAAEQEDLTIEYQDNERPHAQSPVDMDATAMATFEDNYQLATALAPQARNRIQAVLRCVNDNSDLELTLTNPESDGWKVEYRVDRGDESALTDCCELRNVDRTSTHLVVPN